MEDCRRSRSKPKKYWKEVIIPDITQFQLTKDITSDKRLQTTWIGVKG